MAYGQTGSGKTHTMVGDHSLYDDLPPDDEESKEGIIPRSAKEIIRLVFNRCKKTSGQESKKINHYSRNIKKNRCFVLLHSTKIK